MKVKELIQQDIDIDVYDDVCEELAIAFCGPQVLTEEGEKEFADVMEYEVEINEHSYGGYPAAIVLVDDPDESVWKQKLNKAKRFFDSAAGHCSCYDYVLWFKEG